MIDFATARRMMVDGQVRTADVTEPRVLAPMLDLPREQFMPEGRTQLAYLDLDVPVGESSGSVSVRRLLKPMVLARLLQAAEIAPGDRVLDVGCASGYSAAVLARMAERVVALEEDADLARQAQRVLSALGIANVTIVNNPLAAGWPGEAPYDVIVLNGAAEVPPGRLFRQLKDGGRLVCILGRTPGRAMLYRSIGGDVSGRPLFDAAASLLPGFAAEPAFVF